MFSCTKRSDKDEDEKTQTEEQTKPGTEVANSENPNSESPQSENPVTDDSKGTGTADDSKGTGTADDSKGGNNNSGSTTSPKIDQTVANSEDAKYLALDKEHNSTTVSYSQLSSGGGKCELDGFTGDFGYASINETDYKNGLMAGAYLKVTGPKGTIGVVVVNTVPGESGVLCLDEKDFEKIADKNKSGKVTWKVAALPTDEPVSFKYGAGSSKGYFKIQVRNHRYPVKKLEVKQNGKYVDLPKQDNNCFVKEDGLGAGPYAIRLTDVFGHVIEETIPLKAEGEIVSGKNNFPK